MKLFTLSSLFETNNQSEFADILIIWQIKIPSRTIIHVNNINLSDALSI